MLLNVPKVLSPELLKVLSEMGHGSEIVIADANFPSTDWGRNAIVVRADGIGGVRLLDAILEVIPLDTYATDNAVMMEVVKGDPTPTIWAEYEDVINKHYKSTAKISHMERFSFYDRVKKDAYCVIATGEEAVYANIILKKGVIK